MRTALLMRLGCTEIPAVRVRLSGVRSPLLPNAWHVASHSSEMFGGATPSEGFTTHRQTRVDIASTGDIVASLPREKTIGRQPPEAPRPDERRALAALGARSQRVATCRERVRPPRVMGNNQPSAGSRKAYDAARLDDCETHLSRNFDYL